MGIQNLLRSKGIVKFSSYSVESEQSTMKVLITFVFGAFCLLAFSNAQGFKAQGFNFDYLPPTKNCQILGLSDGGKIRCCDGNDCCIYNYNGVCYNTKERFTVNNPPFHKDCGILSFSSGTIRCSDTETLREDTRRCNFQVDSCFKSSTIGRN